MDFLKRIYTALLPLLLLSSGASLAADLDVPFSFSTIETDHFSIHYHQGFEDAGRKTAFTAESVHGRLTKEFNRAPSEKTHIVLIDDSDLTNSFSTVLPYNAIYIQAVPPLPDTFIGEYDDWLEFIITHEYAHILSNDSSRGYSSVMRSIFGKPIPGQNPFTLAVSVAAGPPNVYLPAWWQEGAAAWAETEYTKSGRGRSAYNEMVVRMAVAQDNVPPIDMINGEVPDWPRGHAPYVFGLELQRHIAENYGRDAISRLNMRHSGRFPYFLNGAPSDLLGKDYIKTYDEMVRDLKKRESGEIEALEKGGLTPFNVLGINGESVTNPRYSPDGKMIAVNRVDPDSHEAIIIAASDGREARDSVRRLPSDHVITWHPDSSKIYFCQEEVNSGFYIYQDLYSYNLKTRRLKRLTYGMRLREPDLSPDGKRFAAVINKRGSQNLAIIDAPEEGGTVDESTLEVVSDYKLMRLSGPRWSPDGASVAYSVTDNSGSTAIFLYDLKNKTHRKLFSGGYAIVHVHPAWSKDGRFIIYSSNETRVYNLYAYSVEDGAMLQITNILGGAFSPEVSPDGKGIVFSSYDSHGFKAAVMEYNPMGWRKDHGPYLKPFWKERGEGPPAPPEEEYKVIKKGPGPYRAYRTLPPRFWLPTLLRDHDGVVIGAYTAGQDVLAYNIYQLEADYGAASSKAYYNAVYIYDYFYPTFTLEARARPVLYSDLLRQGNYYELNRSYTFKTAVPLNRLESSYSFILGYTWQRQSALSSLTGNRFRNIEPFQGRRGFIFAGVEFSNTLKYPYSISHEEGRSFSLLYRAYSKAAGSRVNSREYVAAYSEYITPFKGETAHNVIYLNLKGGVSAGQRVAQQAFQLGGIRPESDFPLRGFPSRFSTGKYIATGTIEYRAPLSYIYRGLNTKPFFWEKLHGSIFADAGEVWGDGKGLSSGNLKFGAGLEARLDMVVGYKLKVTPALGFAHGFNRDGDNRVYFTIYSNL